MGIGQKGKGPIDVLLVDADGMARKLFSFEYGDEVRIGADSCRPDIAFRVDGELWHCHDGEWRVERMTCSAGSWTSDVNNEQ